MYLYNGKQVYYRLLHHRHGSFIRSIALLCTAAFTTLCIILRMHIYFCSFFECSYFYMHFWNCVLCYCNSAYYNYNTTMFDFSITRHCKYRRGIQLLPCVLPSEGGGSVTSQLQTDPTQRSKKRKPETCMFSSYPPKVVE